MPMELDPQLLLCDEGKRPDGITRIPWTSGKDLVWDFTCTDTVAPSHIYQNSLAAGAVASQAESNKSSKYSALDHGYMFIPFALETGDVGSRCARLLFCSESKVILCIRRSALYIIFSPMHVTGHSARERRCGEGLAFLR
jgi:hypothetical protein